MATIYVADDDKDILRIVDIFLKNEGYTVYTFNTGDELLKMFKAAPADLVILDIMMPGTDGLSICQAIRAFSDVPIIILTAKDTDADYIVGITLGSDDYLVKPFKPTVLSMRVKALLRRVAMSKKSNDQNLVCGDLVYDVKSHAILTKGISLNLTKTEFSCVLYMMHRFNEAISREDLLHEVWGYDSVVETRVTDEVIRKIRKKLKQTGSSVSIKNKWGYGYMMTDQSEV